MHNGYEHYDTSCMHIMSDRQHMLNNESGALGSSRTLREQVDLLSHGIPPSLQTDRGLAWYSHYQGAQTR